MRTAILYVLALAISSGAQAKVRPATGQGHIAHGRDAPALPKDERIRAPASMQAEHREIHERLVAATRQAGPVGEAARRLSKVLDPHFQREEQIALPPLGLLVPLARGEYDEGMLEVLPLTDALRAEWARMLSEHQRIGEAARELERVAREQGNADVEELAKQLQLHAGTEEALSYPAAILVGDLVRARAAEKGRK